MSSDQLTHRLVLPSVRLSDAGEYTAVAGSNMSKANLGVEGRDVKISEPSDRNVSVSSHILDGSSPVHPTVLVTPGRLSSEVGGEVEVSNCLQTNLSIKPHTRRDRTGQTCPHSWYRANDCLILVWRTAESDVTL